jgi:DNA replication protein DnaC
MRSNACPPPAAAVPAQGGTGGPRDRPRATPGSRRSRSRPARRGSGRARHGHDPDAPPRIRLPAGKTFDVWDEAASAVPTATQHSLKTLEWLGRAENLCLCGPSGAGKSHLVEALGHLAIDHGKTVAWHTLESLTALVRRHRPDDTVSKAISRLIRADLIVIDDVGMLPVSLEAAEALFRVVDAAYERRSLAITSNLHPSGFDELMPKTLAAATVDRLLHHAHVLVCEGGESYRLAQATRGHGVTPLTTTA